jgi:hypothetical protein
MCRGADLHVNEAPVAPPAPAIGSRDARPDKSQRTAMVITASLVIIVGLFWLGLRESDRDLSPGNKRYNDNWYRIRDNCRTAIGARSHDKSSAEWGGEDAHESGDSFIITYELRAKNAFGAYRLTNFICTVDKATLRVVSIAPTG